MPDCAAENLAGLAFLLMSIIPLGKLILFLLHAMNADGNVRIELIYDILTFSLALVLLTPLAIS